MQNNHNLNLDEIVTLSVKAFKSENFDLHQYYLELLENRKITKIQEAQSAAEKGDVDKVDEIILEIKNAQFAFSKNNIEIEDNVKNLFDITDRSYVLSEQTIIAEGTPNELLKSSKAVEHYFGKEF